MRIYLLLLFENVVCNVEFLRVLELIPHAYRPSTCSRYTQPLPGTFHMHSVKTHEFPQSRICVNNDSKSARRFSQEPCSEDVAGSGGIAVFTVDQLHAPAASLSTPGAGLDTVTYLSSVTILYRMTAVRRRGSTFVCPPPAGHSSWVISRQQQKKWQVLGAHPQHSWSGCVQSGADRNTCRIYCSHEASASCRLPHHLFGTKPLFHLKASEMPALREVLEIEKLQEIWGDFFFGH